MRPAGSKAANAPPLTWRVRLRVLRAACRALLYLHTPLGAKGEVLHRDIKPANILLDEQHNAKLADVGLASRTLHPAPATCTLHPQLAPCTLTPSASSLRCGAGRPRDAQAAVAVDERLDAPHLK